MMPNVQPLVAELHEALANTPGSKYSAILSRVTELFLTGAASYADDHVAIFDDVIGRLIEKVEHSALIELSAKLAPIANAPAGVIRRLSQDDDFAVSGPILESKALSDDMLAEVATTKGPRHLSAIAGRAQIGEPVTDALLERGLPDITLQVIRNEGARISELGFAKLINRATSDKSLAADLASRKDLPAELKPFLDMSLA